MTLQTQFNDTRSLTVATATAQGYVIHNPVASDYVTNSRVSLKALPKGGYLFSRWTGDVPAGLETANPLVFTMDTNKIIQASFTRPPATCSIAKASTGEALIMFTALADVPYTVQYRDELGKLGIVFNRLLTITNMPAGRFLGQLRRQGHLKGYRGLLERSFNLGTLDKLMCLDQIDVGWDGTVYDCDFNLAMGLPARLPSSSRKKPKIGDLDPARDARRLITTGEHCFGCTAGAGSSCGGALEK